MFFVQKVDVIANAVNEIIKNTKEYLQPNPTIRARMNMMSISTKIQVRYIYIYINKHIRQYMNKIKKFYCN